MVTILLTLGLISISILFFKGFFKKNTAIIISLFQAAIFSYFLHLYLQNQGIITESYAWIDALNIEFNFILDGVSYIFALLITGIGTLVFLYAQYYMKKYERTTSFYAYLTLFSGAMLGLVLSGNLIQLFVFWELTSVLSFLLITFFHQSAKARKAAFQSLFITIMGGLALLAGIIILGAEVDSYNINVWTEKAHLLKSSEQFTIGLILILIGVFTKSAQFPFHFWLPGAMQAPTPVSAYLHSATMVKAGFFLLLKLQPSLGGTPEWFYIISSVGVVTMFIGVYFAILQKEIKAVLAYTTINALGVLTLLMGLDTYLSVKAALLFLIIHAFYKATLFMVAGIIDKYTGTRLFNKLGGLAGKWPFLFILTVLAALSMAGFPPMIGFLGKELIYEAKTSIPDSSGIVLVIGVLSNILLVAVSIVFIYQIFIKKTNKQLIKQPKINLKLISGPALLVFFSLIFGLFPQFLGGSIINDALVSVFNHEVEAKLKLWHGFNDVFFLSLFTIISGMVFSWFLIKYPAIRMQWNKLNNKIILFRFSDVFLGSITNFVRFSGKNDKFVQHGYHRYYLLTIFLVTSALLWIQFYTTRAWTVSVTYDSQSFYITSVIILTILSSIFAIFIQKRLATVVVLGVSGYGIALVYMYYSAVDLAITQILVETLIVVLFVIVLQKLPRFAKLSSWKVKVRDLAIAITFGTIMGFLALTATEVNLDVSLYDFYSNNSLPKGFGRNVVNVILVDFRALDTLGEILVLSIAALGVSSLLTKNKEL